MLGPRCRSRAQARGAAAAALNAPRRVAAAQRFGRQAVQRRAAQAAAASLVLMVFVAAAAASSAARAVAAAAATATAAPPLADNTTGATTAEPLAPLEADGGSGGRSTNSSAAPAGGEAGNAMTTRGSAAAAAAAGAAATTTVPPVLRLLPGPCLTSAPNATQFEVFRGCAARAYGIPGLPDFAVYCEDRAQGRNVSYWHEIPLNLTTDPRVNGSTMWVTVEIPRGTNVKIETQTMWPHAPMAQSTLDGMVPPGSPRPLQRLRYYAAGPSLANYGGVPQTWEASDVPDGLTGLPSDNDPLDFIEVGVRVPAPVRRLRQQCLAPCLG
ncbi:hypothetical protein PLESTM_000317900 [Pleodorina starrii]|nr:hypothetical protein PLESTM_000317900 [Pleodorina starrii]